MLHQRRASAICDGDAGIDIPASRHVTSAGAYNNCLQYDVSATLMLTLMLTLTQHSASVTL